MKKHLLNCVFLLAIVGNLTAQKIENLALTPPMGWNSWITFECNGVNEKVINVQRV